MEALESFIDRPRQEVRFAALDPQHASLRTELQQTFERLPVSSEFTLGDEVEQFEAEFARYSDTDHCVGVSLPMHTDLAPTEIAYVAEAIDVALARRTA